MRQRAVFLSDIHAPFHDERALNLALDITEDITKKNDEVILCGDFLDFYNVNQHGKDHKVEDMEYEIAMGIEMLQVIADRFCGRSLVYLVGNHETRVFRYLQKFAPEMACYFSLPDILRLKEFGYKYVPYGPYQKYHPLGIKNLIARHEPPAGGGMHFCNASITKSGLNCIFGHHHQVRSMHSRDFNGKHIEAHSLGHLANIKSPVMGYVKQFHKWSQGFGILDKIDDYWNFQNILIKDYKCIVDGYQYEA